jgi:uncharacterized protein YebE (UPF0316 family)
MLEILIYVFGLSLIFNDDQGVLAMAFYAIGFGIGVFVGTKVEKMLALGYIRHGQY